MDFTNVSTLVPNWGVLDIDKLGTKKEGAEKSCQILSYIYICMYICVDVCIRIYVYKFNLYNNAVEWGWLLQYYRLKDVQKN